MEGGIAGSYIRTSNEVELLVEDESGADVWVRKTAPSEVLPGGTLTYTVTVGNNGPAEAVNVVLRDHLPQGLTNATYSRPGEEARPWPSVLSLGDMPANSRVVITITATVEPDAPRILVNTAEAVSDTPDPNPANNISTARTRVIGPRDQAITDIVESVALQEAALAHILNAEGEKMQKFLQIETDAEELMELNRSVTNLLGATARLESVLQTKLRVVK